MNNNEYIIETNGEYYAYPDRLVGRYGIYILYMSIQSIWDIIYWPLLLFVFIVYNVMYCILYKGERLMIPKQFLHYLNITEVSITYGNRIISHVTLDNPPNIKPCDETRDIPEVYEDLLTYDPPFGYEQGFNHLGVRYGNIHIPIEGKYTVEELSEYVDVLIWSNPDAHNYTATEMDRACNDNLGYFGNVAYLSLYHNNQEIRDECLKFLKYKDVLK